MIKIEYKEDGIKVEAENLSDFFSEDLLPLKVKFTRQVSGNVLWEGSLNPWCWTSFPDSEMIDVCVSDSKDMEVLTHKWNISLHGSFFYKKFWSYCRRLIHSGKSPSGIVIGTHDGEFGEWVPTALENGSKIVLVEASTPQFLRLKENYKFKNFEFVQNLVTSDGGEVSFYEGGKGYTNSVVEQVIKYWEKEEITVTQRNSVKFQDLINNIPDINWIHLDVEGIDDTLLLSLDEKIFEQVGLIVFEYNNLSQERRSGIDNFLKNLGYQTWKEKGICLAEKIKL